jgi:hypothetical protein
MGTPGVWRYSGGGFVIGNLNSGYCLDGFGRPKGFNLEGINHPIWSQFDNRQRGSNLGPHIGGRDRISGN